MSLVGTRPPTVDEYEQYELGHRKRLAMKPGLTGMWQVSGRSDITDFDEVVALDRKSSYIIDKRKFSFTNKMIFRTMRFQFFWGCDILLNGLDDIFADVNSIHMTYLLKHY